MTATNALRNSLGVTLVIDRRIEHFKEKHRSAASASTRAMFKASNGFHVLRERHEIECGECAEAQLAARGQLHGVAQKGFEPAAHVHEALGRLLAEIFGQR